MSRLPRPHNPRHPKLKRIATRANPAARGPLGTRTFPLREPRNIPAARGRPEAQPVYIELDGTSPQRGADKKKRGGLFGRLGTSPQRGADTC